MADALLDVNKEKEKTKWSEIKKKLYKSRQLYVFVIPALVVVAVFSYGPMYGVIIAFKDYIPSLGIFGSPWVGFKHFQRFFDSYYFWDLIKNTLGISIYSLVVGFPLPIILALALNELKDGKFKKFTQTVTYAPNFISVVVVCGMLIAFLTPSTGIINHLLFFLGFERISFMTDPRWFKTIYVLSGVWQGTGWGSVIYLAALSGVDTQLHEAATVDGATRWQRIWYINLPTIIPTMVILLIMNVGSLMSLGYEKILLMQNALNMDSSNVIATFVYKQGLLDAQYSYASAVGLFNAAINAFLLITVNKISRKVSETSLW
ncbi:sugar ABC transporter permease [Enterococcus hirae]|uniref:ABC transmembrane type-1 domain-containing protein n=1 Tax=Enterococcus hirae TaxID=1354 RepID=A0AB37IED8_ENTHR|nr:ABC transporter permease subunit [Enterococcus hirae]EMF0151641.1 sugar ABC transporter permease [Enterococcus hirae]EMF0242898.1 sugar ABC transporter permease [Enterococcus hirae]EMF0424899.1 sugar ABC transporter permease [Enterococcus hirae]EMF0436507.1 sugar ABC transporter permease [Enterococcus hirae]EMF0485455.1 sugar ABC transporter permease [Enterococcus hirae]